MSQLPGGPPVGERNFSNHDCVAASLAWVCVRLGRGDTLSGIIAWLTANGWDTSNGVTIEHAAAYCSAHGIAQSVSDGGQPMSTYVPAGLSQRCYTLGFHQCDGNANPVPVGTLINGHDIRHCRAFYGNDGGYQTMNPWPPANQTVATATMQAADTRQHLTVLIPVPAPAPPTPLPAIEEHTGMDSFTGDDGTSHWFYVDSGGNLREVYGPDASGAWHQGYQATGCVPLSSVAHLKVGGIFNVRAIKMGGGTLGIFEKRDTAGKTTGWQSNDA